MTDDELDRLRGSLLRAHDQEDLGLFLTIVERIRSRFQGPLKQPKPILLRPPQAESDKNVSQTFLR